MVNWTSDVLDIETPFDNSGTYDLPVPDDTYECHNYIDEVDDILGLFESDNLYDELKYHEEYGLGLFRSECPTTICDPSEDFTEAYKMWAFKDEVIHTCIADNDQERINFLLSVCQHYMVVLYDYLEVLGGDITDLDL